MSDEIARVVEQDVAKPMLKAVEDIGETVPTHFSGIGERLEGAATAHLENESKIVSSIEGVNPGAAESGAARAAERGASSGGRDLTPVGGGESLGEGDRIAEAQQPGEHGASDDPVDLVTGEMFLPERDLALPGILALVLERTYRSSYRKGRWFGRSWASTLDQRIGVDDDGVHYAAADGVVLHYPVPQQPGQKVMPAQGARWPLSWDRAADTIRIEVPERGHTLHFPPGPTPEIARPLAALTDRNNNRITFAYDDEGVPTDVYHSGGYHVLVERDYTASGPRIRGLSLADPAGGAPTEIVTFGYDAAGRLSESVNSSGLPLILDYDAEDRITGWTDRNGYRYEYRYDDSGRVVHSAGTGGYLTAEFAYDDAARTTTLTDSLGHATVHHWNERGQVHKIVDPLGGVSLIEQDAHNRVLSYTDALGQVTRYRRDEHGNAVRVERPDGTVVQAEYNELRLPVRVVGVGGGTWQYTYDARGNLTALQAPDATTTMFEYDEHGAMASAVDALGQTTRYEADRAGLATAVIDARGARGSIRRDAFGRSVGVTDAAGASTRMGWTTEGRPAWRVGPDEAREEWSYDAEGNLVEYRDPLGGAVALEYGPFDKLVARTDASGATVRFAYDAELRLSSVTGGHGRAWRYEYDAVDNLVAETDFNDRRLTYSYDAARRLTGRVNGAGQAVSFRRDAAGRVLEREAGDAVHRFAYDPAGRLLRAETGSSTLEYTRDRLGRVLTETVDGLTLANEYDAAGRRIRRATPAGAVTQWTYDAAGLPASLVGDGGTLNFQHDDVGRETTRYLGTTAALSQTFDAVGRLATQSLWAYEEGGQDATGSRLLQQRTYTYRLDGLVEELADMLHGDRRYDLDSSGRVVGVQAATWNEAYAYDAFGNVAGADAPGDEDGRGEREYAGTLVRRAGRASYEHDAQGRVVRTTRRTLSGQTKQWTYSWDAGDRLVEASTPQGTWRYTYDPLGRRTAKQRLDADGGVAEEIRFAWDGTRLAEQVSRTPDGRTDAVSWDWDPDGHRALAQTRRGWADGATRDEIDTVFFAIVSDLAGTPAELVAPDGSVAWRLTTSLWGTPIADPRAQTDCPLRFPGQYHDPETGLHYNYFRYYDPATGGYASPDPLGLDPGPNPHAYVDNPLAMTDALGLSPCPTRGAPGFITDQNGVTTVRPPGRPDNDLVLSGHGAISATDTATVTVPEGTTLNMYSNHGQTISDRLGGRIETGNPTPLHTFKPGDQVPDYYLFPPGPPLKPLNIQGSPVTVTGPTRLSDLLRPNMGSTHWAACRETVPQNVMDKVLAKY
jgi:RHS repeat-associated protein